jgi:hypothetical protein
MRDDGEGHRHPYVFLALRCPPIGVIKSYADWYTHDGLSTVEQGIYLFLVYLPF